MSHTVTSIDQSGSTRRRPSSHGKGGNGLGQMEVLQYRRMLQAKQHDLLAARARAEVPAAKAGGMWGDFLDQASAETEADVQVRLRQTDARLLRAIEQALARIELGTFGVCEACNSLIAPARLNAVPWTRLCRDCKEQQST
jgi:DnaK suppressor protein